MVNVKELEELRAENERHDYLRAYCEVVESAEAKLYPVNINWALNYVKDYNLCAYDNYYSAGIYLSEALESFQEKYEDIEKSKEYKEFIGREGLFLAIGDKVLEEANSFLESHGLKEFNEVDFFSDGVSLSIDTNQEHLKEELDTLLKELDLNKIEQELSGRDLKDESFLNLKHLIYLINEAYGD
ncbi:hypothetical protein [Campylobacter helveticus]|uniref:hypothetical protein n=2 Tax=Campylobacter helveticus TaxID=28898 RepID=UPI0009C28235|nr:hypothetical protein [Campylobacter helveticus]ARE79779.1 hypothetical protein CHELV3228_0106 [Campylobacter helveticus]TNB58802.1 hypothetical protein FDW44_04235 [Campylobacter helveticus]TNH31990.1 hypothetical protein FDW48_08840 [Campylobacter helveticus]TXK57887.1 hypothetical protein A9726_00885 [Campylobacter helveticus]SMC19997.1 hypothetical protein SAMN02745125_00850 [Campylobacter helveticus]